MQNFKTFFTPKRVAVIGASSDETKVGGRIFQNARLQKKAEIIPVNNKHKSINGIKTLAFVSDIKKNVDIAVVCVKAEIVPEIIQEIVKKKIPFCIIISSGFKELNEQGKKLEEEISKIIKNSSTRILGPNCLGITTSNLNLTFAKNIEKIGNAAVLSQSGAIGSSLIDYLNEKQIGLDSFVSLGNKLDLSENEFLEYFEKEGSVKSIFLYLESFKNGGKFFKICQKINQQKPIIVIKPGKSKASLLAMTSHTGAMVSDEIVVATAFSQANIIRATNLEDFFHLIKYFTYFHGFKNIYSARDNTIKIVTNAGGIGVLLTDEIQSESIDLGGNAKAIDYKNALLKLPKNTRGTFCVITPQETTEMQESASVIADHQKKVKYPIFCVLPGGKKVEKAQRILNENHCLVFDFPEEAVRIYQKICEYQKKRNNPESIIYHENKNKVVKKEFYDFQGAQKLATEYNLPINIEYPVSDFEGCKKVAEKLKFPVVLKLHAASLVHKTEFNAVRVNIKNEKELNNEYDELFIVGNGRDRSLQQENIITISKHIPSNLEIIIGVKKDPDFGHVMMFGMGGIYAEIMKDLSYGVIPMSRSQIIFMIKKTRSYKIIDGARNLPKLDLKGIIDCIEKLQKLVLENEWISEIDINPLLVSEKEVKIVDLKIK